MGKSNKNNGTSLGRSLQRQKKTVTGRQQRRERASLHHTTVDDASAVGGHQFTSVLDVDDLTDLMLDAELSQRDFAPDRYERQHIVVGKSAVYNPTSNVASVLASEDPVLREAMTQALRIPRRPPWDEETTPEQLEYAERDSFLQWRKRLADLEEEFGLGSVFSAKALTPFEKNIEIWRQLWRVVERSDVVCQILDARNPLLYYCQDLDRYTYDMSPDKRYILLINKADFLSPNMLKRWKEYFESQKLEAYFFSAKEETARKEEEQKTQEKILSNDAEGLNRDEEEDGEDEPLEVVATRSQEHQDRAGDPDNSVSGQSEGGTGTTAISDNSSLDSIVLNADQLLDVFRKFLPEAKRAKRKELEASSSDLKSAKPMEFRCVVGMVGYPNVGKSSTINAILGAKRVAVSATPGKTKHFQTFVVDDDLVICDCPGLVFPSFSTSRADLICHGILSIDHMRDPLPPMQILASRIPSHILEDIYGMNLQRSLEMDGETLEHRSKLDDSSQAMHILTCHAISRGFMSGEHGGPNINRSARILLKDYVNGKLLYCFAPPGSDILGEAGRGTVMNPDDNTDDAKISANSHDAVTASTASAIDADDLERYLQAGSSTSGNEPMGQQGQSKSRKRGKNQKSFANGVTVHGRQHTTSLFTGARVQNPFPSSHV